MLVPRIELGSQPWEGRILPLNHTRNVPGVGLEPTQGFPHSILSRGCLPISAPGRMTPP